MKKYFKYIICIFIFFGIVFLITTININKEYSKNLYYMDTYINIKITCNNKYKAQKALNDAENLFKDYHNLTNRYDKNSELYLLNHHKGELKTDKKLYELISYAYSWYSKTNELFNINIGEVIDTWKKYRDRGSGIPTKEELNTNININNIELLGNNVILNKGANLDLGGIVKGYVTKLVGIRFKKLGIKDYIINAGGNVLVGEKDNSKYKIGIESPLKDGNIYQIVKGNNISVVTSGSYERFYEYDGKLYHHIINPNTLYPSEYMKSVTIISDDSALSDILSTTLFLMPIDEGVEYLKNYSNVEAIWYSNNNEIIKSEGFNKYE